MKATLVHEEVTRTENGMRVDMAKINRMVRERNWDDREFAVRLGRVCIDLGLSLSPSKALCKYWREGGGMSAAYLGPVAKVLGLNDPGPFFTNDSQPHGSQGHDNPIV